MYDFALLALLALALVKTVDFVVDQISMERMRSLFTIVGGVAVALALDYSIFTAWGINIRDAGMGTWVTGFILAGMTVPWRALFGFVTHDKAASDETLGDHRPLLSRAS